MSGIDIPDDLMNSAAAANHPAITLLHAAYGGVPLPIDPAHFLLCFNVAREACHSGEAWYYAKELEFFVMQLYIEAIENVHIPEPSRLIRRNDRRSAVPNQDNVVERLRYLNDRAMSGIESMLQPHIRHVIDGDMTDMEGRMRPMGGRHQHNPHSARPQGVLDLPLRANRYRLAPSGAQDNQLRPAPRLAGPFLANQDPGSQLATLSDNLNTIRSAVHRSGQTLAALREAYTILSHMSAGRRGTHF